MQGSQTDPIDPEVGSQASPPSNRKIVLQQLKEVNLELDSNYDKKLEYAEQ